MAVQLGYHKAGWVPDGPQPSLGCWEAGSDVTSGSGKYKHFLESRGALQGRGGIRGLIDRALARLAKLLAIKLHNLYNRKVEAINIEVVFTRSKRWNIFFRDLLGFLNKSSLLGKATTYNRFTWRTLGSVSDL